MTFFSNGRQYSTDEKGVIILSGTYKVAPSSWYRAVGEDGQDHDVLLQGPRLTIQDEYYHMGAKKLIFGARGTSLTVADGKSVYLIRLSSDQHELYCREITSPYWYQTQGKVNVWRR